MKAAPASEPPRWTPTPADRIIIFGRSLGGAVAAELASRQPGAAGLIVESTFHSIRDVAGRYVSIPGAKYLAPNYYPSADRVKNLKMPLLVIHSNEDDIIPYESGKKLYDAAGNSDKEFFDIHGSHNSGWADSMATYKPKIEEFLKRNLSK